jgi:hypothetical protein
MEAEVLLNSAGEEQLICPLKISHGGVCLVLLYSPGMHFIIQEEPVSM